VAKISLTFLVCAFLSLQAFSAEPRLSKIRIRGHELLVEVVESDEDRSRGLMFRESLPASQGMLFVFSNQQTLTFWMKNTKIPLSIGFFSNDLTLIDVQDMAPESLVARELPRYSSRAPATLALEVNQGWFDKNKIRLGSRIEFINPPKSARLRELIKGAKR